MISFLPGFAAFAAAGLIAAAAPTLIHLLNRRRFRVVSWGAMDFLRVAMKRSRRLVRLRDLALLTLRTAAVLLFGLALARPFFGGGGSVADPGQPVHAVLIVDNSLSMGYRRGLEGTVLDEAKRRGGEFIESLNERSWISVAPLCGGEGAPSSDPYPNRAEALSALARIETVDRRGSAARIVELAAEACRRAPQFSAAATRIVFLGDQQQANWPSGEPSGQLAALPELQVVDVSGGARENSWIEDLYAQDGVADAETPTTFVVRVRHQGAGPRKDVPVALQVGDDPPMVKTMDLVPGQRAEVAFLHQFEPNAARGGVTYVPVKASLSEDRLPEDDVRYLEMPVVARLPVAFVDPVGDSEDPSRERFGETWPLRRLLSPKARAGDEPAALVQVRQLRIDQLDREALRDVRLAVVAGVERPGGAVRLLREYVEQGGQLLIAAGGEFDPVGWNEDGWQEGEGVLPAPVESRLMDVLAGEGGGPPFYVNYDSLSAGLFELPDTSREDHVRLFTLGGETGWRPLFFRAIRCELDGPAWAGIQEREAAAQAAAQNAGSATGNAASTAKGERVESEEGSAGGRAGTTKRVEPPDWLDWGTEGGTGAADDNRGTEERGGKRLSRPRVLAAFSNGVPYLVEREIGKGRVVFASSGLTTEWSLIAKTDLMYLFDRLMRSMILRTLSTRNLSTAEAITLPVGNDRRGTYSVRRPDGRVEPLTVEALGEEAFGLTIRGAWERGIYEVRKERGSGESEGRQGEAPAPIALAVNGPAEESDLASLDEAEWDRRLEKLDSELRGRLRWVKRGEGISMTGGQAWGEDLWWWLALGAMVLLLGEMLVLGLATAQRGMDRAEPREEWQERSAANAGSGDGRTEGVSSAGPTSAKR